MLQTVQNKHAAETENSNMSAAFKVGDIFNTRSITRMGLFGKKPAKELPPLFSETEIDGANYDQVLDFLVSVNDDDYKKIIKVADTYRKTHGEVAKITGLEREAVPSIFEKQTQPPVAVSGPKTDTGAGNFLDEDDDLTAAFLTDDQPTQPPVTPPATEPAKDAPKNETANLQS